MRPIRAVLFVIAAAFLAGGAGLMGGCQREFNPTPYVMLGDEGRAAYAKTAAALRTAGVPVLYVTDRAVDKTDERGPKYGYGRNPEMAFGTATVSLGAASDWDALVADSTSGQRTGVYAPRVAKVEEAGRITPLPRRLEVFEGRLRGKDIGTGAMLEEFKPFDALVEKWVGKGGKGDAYVFVHGYNNKFDDAVVNFGQAWHLMGRPGVPVVFTWPAGSGGLRGYTYDRESGEFAVVHLKVLLAMLARCPGVSRVHLISHSRGTDVASTALRELNAEIRGAMGTSLISMLLMGKERPPGEWKPAPVFEVLKLETLVLAAPDLDLDVFIQRFFGENVMQAARRVVIYFSEEDEAIGTADWLFRSRRRLGALHLEDIPAESRPMFGALSSLEMINCKVTGYTSHSYILRHPAAMSDLIRVVRDGKAIGAENGRPLGKACEGVWEMDNDYLKPKP